MKTPRRYRNYYLAYLWRKKRGINLDRRKAGKGVT